MYKPKIMLVVGTRPEVIRMSTIIKELKSHKKVQTLLVHTGQHYSEDMSQIFFDQLKIDKPIANMNIGSSDSASQTSQVILKSAEVLNKFRPDVVCVWGDTNSSLGAAIAANKLNLKLAHIEAGCRSFDYRMAEEHNRIIIDHISDFLFPLSKNDLANLVAERVRGKIIPSGDPLYDTFLQNMKNLKMKKLKEKLGIKSKYAIVTLHRAENVDDISTLKQILKTLSEITTHQILFPIHPRTAKMIEMAKLGHILKRKHIITTEPFGYMEILECLKDCDFVITDSGGFQKEAFFAKKPCLTLRKSTEWLDTVRLGVNVLLNPQIPSELKKMQKYLCKSDQMIKKFSENQKPYGKGDASSKIASSLVKLIV